jgi:hypothetical protein
MQSVNPGKLSSADQSRSASDGGSKGVAASALPGDSVPAWTDLRHPTPSRSLWLDPLQTVLPVGALGLVCVILGIQIYYSRQDPTELALSEPLSVAHELATISSLGTDSQPPQTPIASASPAVAFDGQINRTIPQAQEHGMVPGYPGENPAGVRQFLRSQRLSLTKSAPPRRLNAEQDARERGIHFHVAFVARRMNSASGDTKSGSMRLKDTWNAEEITSEIFAGTARSISGVNDIKNWVRYFALLAMLLASEPNRRVTQSEAID